MEFPDFKAKRVRTIKLFIGYFLMVILVGLATLILVYLAQGYGYDSNKGVMQNGLVFIDSKPSAASIYLNSTLKDKTNSRLVLGEGSYGVTLKKDKYRDWDKTFNLEGGTVLYFLYPKLFPVDIPVGITRVFPQTPAWASQSPDRRWLVIQQTTDSPVLTIVDLQNPNDDPVLYTIPAGQLASVNAPMSPLEWSDDNKHLLLLQKLPDGTSAYIVIDRSNTDQTVNVSAKLNITSTVSLTLMDKKYDKYYLLDSSTGELKTADLKNGVGSMLVAGVVAYKSYADNLIFYVTYQGAESDKAQVRVLKDKKDNYLMQDLPRDASARYLLDIAQFDHNWYYISASTSGKNVKVYRNPLSRSNPGNTKPISSQMSLNLDNPQFVSFSDNTRFICMQSGKQFVVYDGEQNRVFRYTSPLEIATATQAKWMDGHRLTVVIDNKVQVFDFDGTNLQALTSSRPEFIPYFDRDYEYIYTLMPQADGKTGFESGQLIL